MVDKARLASLKKRIKENTDELDAEILRTEERLSALKSLREERIAEESEIGATITSLS